MKSNVLLTASRRLRRYFFLISIAAGVHFGLPAAQAASPDVGLQMQKSPFAVTASATQPAFKQTMEWVLWYPAINDKSGQEIIVAENPIFYGQKVRQDAAPEKGQHPLVLLSHGYGGNWRNQSWLAAELVRRGYWVVSVSHAADRFRQRGKEVMWTRPLQLSYLLDQILSPTSAWSPYIDKERIAAVGHSMGGWTLMQLAGGRFDATHFEKLCLGQPHLAACTVVKELGVLTQPDTRSALLQNRQDTRFKALVTLDIGAAGSFTPDSLAQVTVPTLVLAAAEATAEIPLAQESGLLALLLPKDKVKLIEVAGAKHLSFLQHCKPEAMKLLEEENETIACENGKGADRAEIHRHTSQLIVDFLAQHLK